METPWQRARKTASVKQEARLGDYPGSRRQPGSGRIPGIPRDARMFNNFLVEARTTEADQYCISKKEFDQLTEQGFKMPPGCLPAFQPTIQGLELWVMRLKDFNEFQEQLIILSHADVS